MSVIIRLQNLPWSANAIDIRRYFQGLSIPDGGVHIVGGEQGDAFMAFSTDEDARKAMQLDGRRLGDASVKLLLSSKNEMQSVIAAARKPAPSAPMAMPNVPSEGGAAPPIRTDGGAPFTNEQRFTPGPHGRRPEQTPGPLGGPAMPRPPGPGLWAPRPQGFGRGGPMPNVAEMAGPRPAMMRGQANFQGGNLERPEARQDNAGFQSQNSFGMDGAARNEQGRRPMNESPAGRRDLPRADGLGPRPGFATVTSPAHVDNNFGRGPPARDMRSDERMQQEVEPFGRGPDREKMQQGPNRESGERPDMPFGSDRRTDQQKVVVSPFNAQKEGFGRGRPQDGMQGPNFPGGPGVKDFGNRGDIQGRNIQGFAGDKGHVAADGGREGFGRPMQMPDRGFGRGSLMQDNRPGLGRGMAPMEAERPVGMRDLDSRTGPGKDGVSMRRDPPDMRGGPPSGFGGPGPNRDQEDSSRGQRPPFGRGGHDGTGFNRGDMMGRDGGGFNRGDVNRGGASDRSQPMGGGVQIERPGFGRGIAMQEGFGQEGLRGAEENGGFAGPQMGGNRPPFGGPSTGPEDRGFGRGGPPPRDAAFGRNMPKDTFTQGKDGFGLGMEGGASMARGDGFGGGMRDQRDLQQEDSAAERMPPFGRGGGLREPEGPMFGRALQTEDDRRMFGRDGPGPQGAGMDDDRFNRDGIGRGGSIRDARPEFGNDQRGDRDGPGPMLRMHPSDRDGPRRDGPRRDGPFGRDGPPSGGPRPDMAPDRDSRFDSPGMGRPDFSRGAPRDEPRGLLGAAPGDCSGALMPPNAHGGRSEPFGGDPEPMEPEQRNRCSGDERQSPPRRHSRPDHEHDHRRNTRDSDRHDRKRTRETGQCFFISGLTRDITFRDVRKFFLYCEIPSNGLKLINDKSGNRVGEVYVRFMTSVAVESAMKRDGAFIGDRRVKLQPCTQHDFDRAVDSYMPSNAGGYHESSKRARSRSPGSRRHSEYDMGDTYLAIRNLAIKTEKQDLKKFFTSLRLVSGSLFIEYNVDLDRANAFLEVANKRDYKEALTYDKRIIKGQAASIFPISKREYEDQTGKIRKSNHSKVHKTDKGSKEDAPSSSKEAAAEPVTATSGTTVTNAKASPVAASKAPAKSTSATPSKTPANGAKTELPSEASADARYAVLLQGLPDFAKGTDVQTFFDGLNVAKRGMHVIYRPDGKACGKAYVEFDTVHERVTALERSMNSMGKNRVKVTAVNVGNVLALVKEESVKAAAGVETVRAPTAGSLTTVVVRNCSFRADERAIEDFFYYCRPVTGSVRIGRDPSGRPMGEATIAFHTQADAQRAVGELHGKSLMGRPMNLRVT